LAYIYTLQKVLVYIQPLLRGLIRPKGNDFGEITLRLGRHYAVQGHSRSLSLVPIESSYAIYY